MLFYRAPMPSDPLYEPFLQAVEAHNAARLPDAERLYCDVLQKDADHSGALQNLGLLLSNMGHHERALDTIRRAVALEQDVAEAHGNLGAVLMAAGLYGEAVTAYEKALALAPDNANIRVGLGVCLTKAGRAEAALEHLRLAFVAKPNSPACRNRLAEALLALRRFEEAATLLEDALRIRPAFPDALSNLGLALGHLGRLPEAIRVLEEAVLQAPRHAAMHANLAQLLMKANRTKEAISHFRAALEIEPKRADAHNNFAILLSRLHRYQPALFHFRKALELRPDFAPAHANVGNALIVMERPEEAMPHFAKALKLDKASVEGRFGMGMAYQMMGNLAESRQILARALQLAPRDVACICAYIEAGRMTADDPVLGALQEVMRDMAGFTPEQQMELHFAMIKVYDDIGDHVRAAEYMIKANRMKRQRMRYDETATMTALNEIQKVFSPELLSRRADAGDPSAAPVFIVGMPRSGTTLVEQILASHPQVRGGGELPFLTDLVRQIRGKGPGDFFPYAANALPQEQLADMGRQYIERLREKGGDVARITDKMPANFRFIGLIRLILPNARIIHARRDAADTCLSCFSKSFKGGIDFAYDLGELGRYWRAYDATMAHWRKVLPEGVMLEVDYETLVSDFENQARRLVAHCGLEWSKECLAFSESRRPVRTASAAQVRMPIYKSSLQRWRHYEAMLQPLLRELDVQKVLA
jgi:tetratricopeptide (TPR) repeat protein